MERRILSTLIIFILLLVEILGGCVLLAQDQASTYIIEEVISQDIYVEGYNGSIVLKIRTPKLDDLDTKVKVSIEQINIGDAGRLSLRVVEEKNISSKEFTYYIYTVYISADQRELPGTDLLCRPLILNISLVGQKYNSNLLYDSKLTIITVCSLKTIELKLRESIKETNVYSLQALEMLRMIIKSIEGLTRNSSMIVNEIPRLREDIKEINSNIMIERNNLSKVLENQSKLRLLTYITLASSSISLLLLIILISLILRIQKGQPVIGL